MNGLRQMVAVTTMALRSLPSRLGTSLIVVIGMAITVAVLICASAVATGFTDATARSGSADRAIVLGGMSEGASSISRDSVATLVDAPGVAHTGSGAPIASAEALISIAFTDTRTGSNAYIPVRGMGTAPLRLRPEISLVGGRLYVPGRREVIVGQAIEERMNGLSIGAMVGFPDGDWKVVGIFRSGGSALESEMLADATSLMNAYRQTRFNSVTLRLDSPQDFTRFSAALASNPALAVNARREDEYYATISRPISRILGTTSLALGFVMAFGAVCGALNTMSSAVRSRRSEIATLRAIGFDATSVNASVVVEALTLAVAGALLGTVVAWLILHGVRVSTMVATGTPLHITFGLSISRRIVLTAALFALGIASIAAIFAARQASRLSIPAAIRN